MHDERITPRRPPWWMAPHLITPLIMLPLLTAALLSPLTFHWQLGRFAKYFTVELYVMAAMGVFAFSLGSFLATHYRAHPSAFTVTELAESQMLQRVLKRANWALFCLAVAAYLIWFLPVARDPSLLLDVLAGRGAERGIRETVGNTPGITSFVQAQIVYATLFMTRLTCFPRSRPDRLEILGFVCIFVLAMLRNLIWSERLAIIELIVPTAILLLRRPRFPQLTALAPVVGFAALISLFSTFEYFRSWSAYYKFQYGSFVEFIIARFSGYYVTALDNGAGLFRDWGGVGAPLNTAEWFWYFPIEIGQTWVSQLLGLHLLDYQAWLYWNATAEFNNPSGIFMPFIDYGAAGGIIFWFFMGIVTGSLFRMFTRGQFLAMMIYPSWFIGILEMPRIHYWFQSRYFTVLLLALPLVFLVSVLATHERQRRKHVAPPYAARG